MNRYFFILLSILFLSGCGSYRTFDISKVAYIDFEYDDSQNLQSGSTFVGKIIAVTNKGERIDVTENNKLELRTDDLKYISDHHFKITKHPSQFEDAQVNFTLVLNGKDDLSITENKTLKLNFKGPLTIDAKGNNGSNGEVGKDKNDAIVFRNGSNGYDGSAGSNGENGSNLNIHVWKEGDTLMIHTNNANTGANWKFKSPIQNNITVIVSGGNGGNGGNGGDGGDGKDGFINSDKSKLPGDGGNGGRGGNGGNGGNPGTISIIFHSNAFAHKNQFSYNQNVGLGGAGGSGGKAGQAGTPAEGQSTSNNGVAGSNGANGQNGTNAASPIIQELDFDWTSFY